MKTLQKKKVGKWRVGVELFMETERDTQVKVSLTRSSQGSPLDSVLSGNLRVSETNGSLTERGTISFAVYEDLGDVSDSEVPEILREAEEAHREAVRAAQRAAEAADLRCRHGEIKTRVDDLTQTYLDLVKGVSAGDRDEVWGEISGLVDELARVERQLASLGM